MHYRFVKIWVEFVARFCYLGYFKAFLKRFKLLDYKLYSLKIIGAFPVRPFCPFDIIYYRKQFFDYTGAGIFRYTGFLTVSALFIIVKFRSGT